MRILTVGAKPAINHALGCCDHLNVWALTNEPSQADQSYESLNYEHGSKLNLESIRQVRQALQSIKPDVVHAFYPRSLAHAVLAASSLRCQTPIVSYRGVTSVPVRWSPDQWITYLSPRVAAHACESAAVADSLVAAGVPRERCHVVHNCLGSPPALLDRLDARQELGIAPDRFLVMMVANMRRVKGADVLLRAAMRCRDLENVHFVLVGRVIDPEVDELIRDPRLDGLVTLAGFRRDASQLLAAADLFVMPSRAEALCVALLEAMSAGVCPLVSDAGGMKEAVRHEKEGVVVSSENIEALADAIWQLHADRHMLCAYGESARERALGYFSAKATADRMASMYSAIRPAA